MGSISGPAADCALECPALLRDALDVVGSKWSAPIFLALHLSAVPVGFADLQRRLAVSPKELTRHLRRLESRAIVRRHVSTTIPPRVDYSVTERGTLLFTALEGLADWARNDRRLMQSTSHDPGPLSPAPTPLAKRNTGGADR
jgi:DNA-binding HxlR family transcriptional regulator